MPSVTHPLLGGNRQQRIWAPRISKGNMNGGVTVVLRRNDLSTTAITDKQPLEATQFPLACQVACRGGSVWVGRRHVFVFIPSSHCLLVVFKQTCVPAWIGDRG